MGHPLTGRGVRIAVVDSGIHAGHPHIGALVDGIAIDAEGIESLDYVDRLGHGTAVAAAIREKAPDAEILAVKVFDRSLTTTIGALVAAIDWAARAGAHLVNLSLGTPRQAHEASLRAAIARAAERGTLIVSARRDDRTPQTAWLPGSLPGVIAVEVDWTIPRDRYRVAGEGEAAICFASGFPRDIAGVPRERNLHGVSFAVANMTGFAACALESLGGPRSAEAIVTFLRDHERADAL